MPSFAVMVVKCETSTKAAATELPYRVKYSCAVDTEHSCGNMSVVVGCDSCAMVDPRSVDPTWVRVVTTVSQLACLQFSPLEPATVSTIDADKIGNSDGRRRKPPACSRVRRHRPDAGQDPLLPLPASLDLYRKLHSSVFVLVGSHPSFCSRVPLSCEQHRRYGDCSEQEGDDSDLQHVSPLPATDQHCRQTRVNPRLARKGTRGQRVSIWWVVADDSPLFGVAQHSRWDRDSRLRGNDVGKCGSCRCGLRNDTARKWERKRLAAEPGFEPELRDPKSLVLPLHYSASPSAALVPRAGLEPARALRPMVFETIASTIPPPRHAHSA